MGGGGSQGHTITPNPLSEAFAAAWVFTCGWSREGAACQPCTEGWAGSWESPEPRLWRMHPAWVSMEDVRDVGSDPWVGKFPWRRKWQPTPVFLPGKFHVLCRSLKLAEPWLKNRGSASWDWFSTEPETSGVVGRASPAARGLRLFWTDFSAPEALRLKSPNRLLRVCLWINRGMKAPISQWKTRESVNSPGPLGSFFFFSYSRIYTCRA